MRDLLFGRRSARPLIVLSSGLLAALVATACVSDVGDIDAGTSGEDDGGSDATTSSDGSPGSDGGKGSATAVTGDVTLYVGHGADLHSDASVPSNGTFAWTVKSAPAGSTITTATLQNASTDTASFTPDLAGDYVITLTVTAPEGATSSADATVHAAPGKLFYVDEVGATSSAVTSVHYVHTDGTGDVAVSCAPTITDVEQFAVLSEGSGVNWIEGAPGDDPVVAFGFVDALPDGGQQKFLAAGKGSSRCDGLHNVGRIADAEYIGGVQLSAGGARIAYLGGTTSAPPTMHTVGIDGSNAHANFGTIAYDSKANPVQVSRAASPRWIDATHVAWARYDGDTTWTVETSADVAAPGTPTVYMTCSAAGVPSGATGTQPGMTELDILPDGNVLADVQGGKISGTTYNLVVFKPDATAAHNCSVVRQITSGANDAMDYALSPDKTQVAFLSGPSGAVSLYVAPVDGSSAPKIVAGSPDGGASGFGAGPHWSADGAWLTWGVRGSAIPLADGGPSPSSDNVVAIAATGGKLSRVAVPTTANERAVAVGNSCSFTPGRAPVSWASGFVALLGLAAARRRNKRHG